MARHVHKALHYSKGVASNLCIGSHPATAAWSAVQYSGRRAACHLAGAATTYASLRFKTLFDESTFGDATAATYLP